MKIVTNSEGIFDIGVIGIGEQSWDNLLPALAVNEAFNITAVSDIDRNKREIAARNYGATPYPDHATLLREHSVDVLVVASQPQVHYEVLKSAIPEGIPTFVEKPPALDISQLYSLANLNQKHKTPTAVGLNFNFAEPVNFLKGLIEDEGFGEIECIKICHMGDKPTNTMWGLPTISKSFLLSQAIHPLGLLFSLGKPSGEFDPCIHSYSNEYGVTFNVNMVLSQVGSGAKFTADLLTKSSAPFFQWELKITSTKGVIVNINSLFEIEVYSHCGYNDFIKKRKWWRETWKPSPLSGGYERNGYALQFNDFVNHIMDGTDSAASIEAMVPVYELMEAMDSSLKHSDVVVA
jgi:predicted dehydrogenase